MPSSSLELPRAVVAALERHETEAHVIGGREIRDLGDALVLHDPRDPDPFWNRLVSVRWPSEPAAFDRRLAEALALFAALGRRPHVWPGVLGDEPPDLVDRLLAHGFEDTGKGLVLALPDAGAALARDGVAAGEGDGDDVRLEVLRDGAAGASIDGAALVLSEAFAAHGESDGTADDRTLAEIEATAIVVAGDLARALEDPRVTLVLARLDGEPAAVAKVTTSDGFGYLSSIGTRRLARGRGLGARVTRAAMAASVAHGADLLYLGVFEGNAVAQRLYERLGFRVVGRPVEDLLLVG